MTDAGLEHIKGLPHLEVLLLGGTRVTDRGLKHVSQLGQVRRLELRDTEVTDAGLDLKQANAED